MIVQHYQDDAWRDIKLRDGEILDYHIIEARTEEILKHLPKMDEVVLSFVFFGRGLMNTVIQKRITGERH